MSTYRAFEWFAYSWAVIVLAAALFVARSFLRVYSTHFMSAVEAKQFLLTSTANQISGVAIGAYALGLVTMFLSAFGGADLWALAAVCMASAAWGWIRRIQPPLVLFLSASSQAADTLYRFLRESIASKGAAVNLLHPGSTSGITRIDTFRTVSPEMWQYVVAVMANVVPVLVLDLRTITSALRDELEIIMRLQLQYKTLILTDSLTAPDIRQLLDGLSLRPTDLATAAVIDVSDLPSAIRPLIASSRSLPTRDRPIAATVRGLRVAI